MYCKKCGHKQAEGEKFCPVCGEPFLDENGKPYTRGLCNNLSGAEEKTAPIVVPTAAQGRRVCSNASKDLKEHRRNRTAPYLIVFFLVACLVVVLAVGGKKVLRRHGGDITKVFKKEESASDLFRSTITSTAYSVPIYETNVFGGWCVVKREVPKSANYDKDLSYQWTIIFYPDDDNHGTAAIVPFTLDGTQYAKAMEASYLYDIKENEINLYNGKTVIGVNSRDDVHLSIEKDVDGNVILTGHFRNNYRKFKPATFSIDRETHRYLR